MKNVYITHNVLELCEISNVNWRFIFNVLCDKTKFVGFTRFHQWLRLLFALRLEIFLLRLLVFPSRGMLTDKWRVLRLDIRIRRCTSRCCLRRCQLITDRLVWISAILTNIYWCLIALLALDSFPIGIKPIWSCTLYSCISCLESRACSIA